MSRPLRIQFEGAIYHVMNRGTNRLPVFFSDEQKNVFLHTLQQASERCHIRIHAYCLMDNHYHLLLETPLPNLSRAMRHIDGVYTQWINRIAGRDGPLFRGRFKSILVQRETYFLALIRYIHMNPVKANLCRRAQEHAFTSHRAYLNPPLRPPWLAVADVLSRWGGDTPMARQRLNDFVHAAVGDKLREQMERPRWPAVLGGNAFQAFARSLLPDQNEDVRSEKPQEKRVRFLTKPEEALKRLENHYQVRFDRPIRRMDRPAHHARAVAMYVLRGMCQLTYAEIGNLMGGVGYETVSKILRRRIMNPEEISKITNLFETEGMSKSET